MSKVVWIVYSIVLLAVSTIMCTAQDIEATIAFNSGSSSIVTVHGRYLPGRRDLAPRNMSFVRSIAGTDNLAHRVGSLRLLDPSNTAVGFKKIAEGEFVAEADFTHWTYEIDLKPLQPRNSAAHVSWFAGGSGILMLADLLPISGSGPTSALIRFRFPSMLAPKDWPVVSSETRRPEGFEVRDIENAVFYVGSNWQVGDQSDEVNTPDIVLYGRWNFGAADADPMAREIHGYYRRVFGSDPAGQPFIAIAKFPQQVGYGEWVAETRGRNVTIISSDMPFRTQSLQRLHEQLRHELFHLWIPNGVDLTGKYDWFYEGFALYQSLRLAVAVNRISFNDFLDTLSRAHTIDSAVTQKTSLIDASNNRFSGANTQIYARGMLVAFLTDLALLERSRGKRSVEDILRELYRKYRSPVEAKDGNTAVIDLLRADPELVPIVDNYVTGSEKLVWAVDLAKAGLEDGDTGPITTLRVQAKLNRRQKTLLDKLGYNNWRKLSPNSK